jgi:hypothetical protein
MLRRWQTAMVHLRLCLPAEMYTETLRYVQLRELDIARGWALLRVPNPRIQARLQRSPLAEGLQEALRSVCGQEMQVAVVVASLEEPPTLDDVLARQPGGMRLADLVGDAPGRAAPSGPTEDPRTPDELVRLLETAVHADVPP